MSITLLKLHKVRKICKIQIAQLQQKASSSLLVIFEAIVVVMFEVFGVASIHIIRITTIHTRIRGV